MSGIAGALLRQRFARQQLHPTAMSCALSVPEAPCHVALQYMLLQLSDSFVRHHVMLVSVSV